MSDLRPTWREWMAVIAAIAILLFVCAGGISWPQQSPIMVHPPAGIFPEMPGTKTSEEPEEKPPAEALAPGLAETDLPPPVDLEYSPEKTPLERQMAQVSESSASRVEQARALLALLPTLPEEALADTAQLAVDRLPDADYRAVALPWMTNPETHGRVLSVLFADLMARPPTLSLPVLLDIARDPRHPFAPAAQDNLQLLTKENFGSDWPRWEKRIREMTAAKPL